MEFGQIIGWVAVGLGLFVAPPQLIKILRYRRVDDIALLTYIALVAYISCALIYAIHIRDAVFITTQSINLSVNSAILVLVIRNKGKRRKRSK